MVRTTKPLWGTVKVVVMDSRFFVLEVLISMVEKGVLGSALIKKRRYCPKGVTAQAIIQHTQNKDVGDVEAVQGSIRGDIYNIMAINDPEYAALMMKTYGTLENLEGSHKHQRYKGVGVELVTK